MGGSNIGGVAVPEKIIEKEEINKMKMK